ncbi:hypothetical protein ACIRBX_28830 [Kitasatospora sp. NPDC096147]|uniref:hypothetical protein n=1 Tax=Kitasatospora sp. NPDC096147 TaxID=3364093 RepID=UPI00381B0F37
MTEQVEEPGQGAEQEKGAESKARRKLVFEDPFDRQTSDDTDRGWGGSEGGGGGDRGLDWYLSQRPPHHGG